jgi:hypothetical protein
MIGHGILAETRGPTGQAAIVVGQVDSAGTEQGRPFLMVGETKVWLDDVKQVFDGRVVGGDIQSINAGAALIGKWIVTEIDMLDDQTQKVVSKPVGGYVTGLTFVDGVYQVMMDNGYRVPLALILEVYNEKQTDLIKEDPPSADDDDGGSGEKEPTAP